MLSKMGLQVQMREFDELNLFQTMAGARHGGAELFFERLACSFHKLGIKQHLVVKHNEDRIARLRGHGIPVESVSFTPLLKPFNKHYLANVIRRSGANIILSWMNRATSTIPKGKIPHVARLGGFYNLKYYQNCDWLVGNSREIVDYLVSEGWPKNRIHYQINFVPDGIYGPKYNMSSVASINDRLVNVVALGRFHPNKAFDTLIKAMSVFEEGRLLLAGAGPLEDHLKELVRNLQLEHRVHFIGWQEDPQHVIRAADIFVCPSRHEPFGNVIAEAMACKKPVVATKTLGAKQMIQDGLNGILVQVDDSKALAGALRELYLNPQTSKNMAGAGREYWRKNLSPVEVTKSWGFLLNQILREG